MKPIEGLELTSVAQEAKDKLKAAAKARLVDLLAKVYEDHDTLVNQMAKDEAAFEKKKKEDQGKLDGIKGKIKKIEAGEWDVIKEDGKGNPQASGDGKGGNKGGGKPDEPKTE